MTPTPPASQPELSVLVVSYQTREWTLACLESLLAETKTTPYEVLVLDNHSSDGSAEAIAERFPSLELFALQENLGFGAANNYLAERARGRRLLLLNPDTVVLDGAVDSLWLAAEQRPDARIWGGRTRFADGTLNPSSCWDAPTPWSALSLGLGLARAFPRSPWFHPEGLGAWQRDTERDVPIVSGCFLMIDRDLWQTLGGFHPDFFMYGEDADLCLRARAHGARPHITPAATIVHYGGASERGVRAGKMVRLFSAKAQLYKKFWGPGAARFGLWTLDLWTLVRRVGFGVAGWLGKGSPESRRIWKEIWDQRSTWHQAFARTQRYGKTVPASRPKGPTRGAA
ncbi:MAG: glycosyltransferase family 2 protein [Planctomycetes bacterium]|nr:glycosyltransferase family 2 protein [Planctomycetota bacterium]MCB9911075.1 glycosyltransferase family 2 protein [Planctomycetota bacterium]MCB9912177.1 glycosyltransferase family 2 protein [Planctomycetota bacterium]HRV82873.1 glycosyltransferase family 2 protein [Planctomycetota bacterium]